MRRGRQRVGRRGVGKADGGFVTAETHFFAGEHGPEVVIPLSSSRRARALDLFEKTAQILGGEPVTFGGDEIPEEIPTLSENIPFVDGNSDVSQPSPVTNATPSSDNSNVVVQLGGVTFNISGENPQDILSTIREHLAEVTDQIAGKLSEQIQTVHANQPLEE